MLIFNALRQAWREGMSLSTLRADVIAGITVGVVAIPLGMALAIAVGVPPQHGLYTVIVAGLLAALLGGSRFNITGPTAAFVVILLPITQQYGLTGLMLATMMSGVILLLMGVLRLGQLVAYVPYPVTTGFTAGIGLTIAFLQLKDLLGLSVATNPIHFPEKVVAYATAMPTINLSDALVGIITIGVFIGWAKLKTKVPAHVVSLVVGTLVALVLNHLGGAHVGLLGEKFHYQIGDLVGQGIPQVLPQFVMPWQNDAFSWSLVIELLPAAFTIAMLGCIESLLCAVVADGMTGTKHNPNAELVGQGLANMVVPFFGGIPATAAIARTATNIRAGAFSPISAIVHALFVLAAMIALAPMLSYVPMSALAGLLIMVAWNMSEAPHFVHTIKVAPRRDVAVLLTCFTLTVVFDMVVAVVVGLLLAGLLFIQRIASLTSVNRVEGNHPHLDLGEDVVVYDINGPLFFAASEKALSVIDRITLDARAVVMDFSDVTTIDISAIHAFENALDRVRDYPVYLLDVAPHVAAKLTTAGVMAIENVEMVDSVQSLRERLASTAHNVSS
ncbi:C4-dicarboxylic acid transporter DauA [Photobacterium aphoticum]|uniref:Transporter n=1 Tax=Photobacterium aphoticum TaxID=754436 RepID=A0A0J1GHT9_9GAMM|nr:C4-dicarboxylic acid transporter DauA [Photobacterium aphoticum]KLU99247.1 transporter [Photobacterium aphoticum]PSU56256.1 C4-dicarboxylic acid transporter DauA [Photobacterium aphoticum]GHA63178.1 sodium-independent anion transporter [Photobacterium aphoticum]